MSWPIGHGLTTLISPSPATSVKTVASGRSNSLPPESTGIFAFSTKVTLGLQIGERDYVALWPIKFN